jgi:TP901 family phage tail tape measure protein
MPRKQKELTAKIKLELDQASRQKVEREAEAVGKKLGDASEKGTQRLDKSLDDIAKSLSDVSKNLSEVTTKLDSFPGKFFSQLGEEAKKANVQVRELHKSQKEVASGGGRGVTWPSQAAPNPAVPRERVSDSFVNVTANAKSLGRELLNVVVAMDKVNLKSAEGAQSLSELQKLFWQLERAVGKTSTNPMYVAAQNFMRLSDAMNRMKAKDFIKEAADIQARIDGLSKVGGTEAANGVILYEQQLEMLNRRAKQVFGASIPQLVSQTATEQKKLANAADLVSQSVAKETTMVRAGVPALEAQKRALQDLRKERDKLVNGGATAAEIAPLQNRIDMLTAQTASPKDRGGFTIMGEKFNPVHVAMWAAQWHLVYGAMRLVENSISSIVQETVAFDREMRHVNTIARMNDQQFRVMKQTMTDMSRLASFDYQAGSKISKGLYFVESAGIRDSAKALDVLINGSQLAIGTMGDLEDSLKGVIALTNIYGREGMDAAKAADMLYATVEAAVPDMREFAGAQADLMVAAAVSKLSFEELGAAYATLTKEGFSAQRAATGVKNVVMTLLKPSDELTDLIQALGYESGVAMLNQLGLQRTLTTIYKAVGENESRFTKLLGSMRSVGAGMGIVAGEGKVMTESLDQIKKSMNEAGGAARAMAEQSRSLGSGFKSFAAQIRAAIESELGPIHQILSAIDKTLGKSGTQMALVNLGTSLRSTLKKNKGLSQTQVKDVSLEDWMAALNLMSLDPNIVPGSKTWDKLAEGDLGIISAGVKLRDAMDDPAKRDKLIAQITQAMTKKALGSGKKTETSGDLNKYIYGDDTDTPVIPEGKSAAQERSESILDRFRSLRTDLYQGRERLSEILNPDVDMAAESWKGYLDTLKTVDLEHQKLVTSFDPAGKAMQDSVSRYLASAEKVVETEKTLAEYQRNRQAVGESIAKAKSEGEMLDNQISVLISEGEHLSAAYQAKPKPSDAETKAYNASMTDVERRLSELKKRQSEVSAELERGNKELSSWDNHIRDAENNLLDFSNDTQRVAELLYDLNAQADEFRFTPYERQIQGIERLKSATTSAMSALVKEGKQAEAAALASAVDMIVGGKRAAAEFEQIMSRFSRSMAETDRRMILPSWRDVRSNNSTFGQMLGAYKNELAILDEAETQLYENFKRGHVNPDAFQNERDRILDARMDLLRKMSSSGMSVIRAIYEEDPGMAEKLYSVLTGNTNDPKILKEIADGWADIASAMSKFSLGMADIDRAMMLDDNAVVRRLEWARANINSPEKAIRDAAFAARYDSANSIFGKAQSNANAYLEYMPKKMVAEEFLMGLSNITDEITQSPNLQRDVAIALAEILGGKETTEQFLKEMKDQPFVGQFAEILQYALDNTPEIGTQLARSMKGAMDEIKDGFTDMFVSITREGESFEQSWNNLMLDLATSLYRNLISKMVGQGADWIWSAITSYSPTPSGFGGVGANYGHIPQFALGGVTNGPVIAGERGREAVVPLPNGRSIPVQMMGAGKAQEIKSTTVVVFDRNQLAQLRTGKNEVVNYVIADLHSNGPIRKTIRKTVG